MKIFIAILFITGTALTSAVDPSPSPSKVPSVAPPGPTSVKPSPSPTSAKPSPTSAKPSPTSAKPSPTSAKPSPTSVKPSPTSVKPSPTSVKPSPTSVKPSPTSVKPSPTSVKPSPTSIKPSPTSVKPSPTSVKPSPTSISPSSSKPAPPASSKIPTLPPITTTPAPKYAVDAEFDDSKTGQPCVWFKANVDVTYKYERMNETTLSLDGKGMEPVTEGQCSNFTKENDTSLIVMSWQTHSLTVEFKVNKNKAWAFSKLGLSLNIDTKANLGAKKTLIASKTFGVGGQNNKFLFAEENFAYVCEKPDKIDLVSNNGTKDYNVTITFNKIMVQPFSNNGTITKNINTCSSKSESSKSSSIVPIAVGCALAGLIVIVLIAYLIGRRKNDGRGYQQV